jgi:predicted choloylglycine hydrolase
MMIFLTTCESGTILGSECDVLIMNFDYGLWSALRRLEELFTAMDLKEIGKSVS